ncbi:molecular chaperone TorD family protein [Halomonas vilamensis]|uniref:Molecular chaperone TorD family protein n=1 Tax=Vreelandella vilamensis TaxID=531309 RepID=A0ABU1H2L4_9GAMM|nr:molecular chaperone TorD family protein [Halomonas vilamensis]MDR5898535.1 molecular chaperone TorD family protein [Halomonas vilamensis]
MMTEATLPDLLPNAELCLCLARAMQAPQAGVTLQEVQGPLMDDLNYLAGSLPVLTAERLNALQRSTSELADTQQLILGYSKLFLMPPAPAPLNLGVYLDGSLMARSVQSIEVLYQRHGLERDPTFHELPDHLSLNLQWLAWVYSEIIEDQQNGTTNTATITDAVTMLNDFTLPALAGIRRKVIAVSGDSPTQLWRLLIELIHDQLTSDLEKLSPHAVRNPAMQQIQIETPATPVETFETSHAPTEQLTCKRCGNPFESDPVLAEMRKRLNEAGVSADHLSICPQCRDGESTAAMKPPGANIKAWQ